ncbi:MAG: low molecular weight protein-tyrosine-phosphatase [Pseudomonadota bacterium]|nr:low molecular weight protein-tyrosine-phosphatase [Pseudomonadota bacterium]
MTQQRLLFVCLGNICRSPMAEGVFRSIAAEAGIGGLQVDSAGTGDWHVGNPPDARATRAARARGVDISGQRARQVSVDDFDSFDIILAMDSANMAHLRALVPHGSHKVRLFLEFAPESGESDVPDPYSGGADGFERALDLIEAASRGLCAELNARRGD